MMPIVQVRLGDRYQAEIPVLRPREELTLERADRSASLRPQPTQRWTPSRFSDAQVSEFLQNSCRLHETELGLQCLYASDFEVPKAALLLQRERRQRLQLDRKRAEEVTDDDFERAIVVHGKKFFLVKQQLPADITTQEVVRRFYLWKTSAAYSRWRERMRAKRNKERARLRYWGEVDVSELSDFHNEHCELCFTGGQLLCCDGCERAYHLSCVNPPMLEIPTGDWFCVNCLSILAMSGTRRESPENPHCNEIVIDDSTDDNEDDEDADSESDMCIVEDTASHAVTELSLGPESSPTDSGHEVSPDTTNRSVESDESDVEAKVTDVEGSPMSKRPRTGNEPTVSTLPIPVVKKEPPSFVNSTALKRPNDSAPFRSPLRTPSPGPDATSSGRKRQRKVVAPRRIPQDHGPTSC